ncbi:Hydrogenase isoenzymes formation protein HypC [Pseudovibrio axinellae]|uniref:Hydrogenase isoenzymes formation protein HypC n=1 Tax=Pseudovibrio axinellae TaxID=989403 RepID=A0A165WA01_9HYPH|nr:HypC/HybG/HupF family hydrogenase formation chaperone [Pseudovibrio axinellae]KZL16267.1 Hydrogenase isoenzymes formation protein HypC [Pseudovibrio axinellae]SER78457.1 hydrogenase expression/formation protein HypC [Pseudovibrio axinellae]
MCLAVPGEIISISGEDALTRTGQVRYGGSVREACLAFVPEAAVGDYILVHAGVAISVLQEDAAQRTFRALEDLK